MKLHISQLFKKGRIEIPTNEDPKISNYLKVAELYLEKADYNSTKALQMFRYDLLAKNSENSNLIIYILFKCGKNN